MSYVPIAIPATIGLMALAVWLVMLFTFRPRAAVDFSEDTIVLRIANAQITRVVRGEDEVTVHLDRKLALERLAA